MNFKSAFKKNLLFKTILKLIIILLCGIFAGTILMIAVFTLPIEPIYNNLLESISVFETEGDYPKMIPSKSIPPNSHITMTDNITDSIMIANAANDSDKSVLDKAMNVYRRRYKDIFSHVNVLIAYKTDRTDYSQAAYSRYWHGYLVFLKPLMLFLNYQQIRLLNTFLQLSLFTLMIYTLTVKNMKKYILPYIISIYFLFPPAVSMSMQFSCIFYIFNIALLILLLKYDYLNENKRMMSFFLLIGMSVSFFDFLTYPTASFCFPMIGYYLLRKNTKFSNDFKDLIKFGTCWTIGYGGMWLGKWLMASILLKENMFASAIQALTLRSSAEIGGIYGRFAPILKAGKILLDNSILVPLTLIFIVFLFYMLRNKRITHSTFNFKYNCLILISLIPIIWYFIASNHSFVHMWFAYRALSSSVFAGLCWILLNTPKTKLHDVKKQEVPE